MVVLVSGKPYQLSGTDNEKIAYLKERSYLDYDNTIKEKVASPYNNYKILAVGENGENDTFDLPDNVVPVAYYNLTGFDKKLGFFELLFQKMERMGMKIPDNPVVCITTLQMGTNPLDITPIKA